MADFKILTLDGGGSKGIYSLGILEEIEAKFGSELSNHFDYFYGTSTGAIIAVALANGKSVSYIKKMYLEKIPFVMKPLFGAQRTERLKKVLNDEFKDYSFETLKKPLGIVATSLDEKKGKIFKSDITAAHGRVSTFVPGFGFSICDALLASCAAMPFFSKVNLQNIEKGIDFSLADGGFTANNPTLLAVIDALKAYKKTKEELRVLNVGTGNFPHKNNLQMITSGIKHTFSQDLILQMFDVSSNTIADITKLLLNDIKILRISDTYAQPQLKTNLLETDTKKLMKLFDQGRVSFGNKEKEFSELFI